VDYDSFQAFANLNISQTTESIKTSWSIMHRGRRVANKNLILYCKI